MHNIYAIYAKIVMIKIEVKDRIRPWPKITGVPNDLFGGLFILPGSFPC